jgi:hypothetical protein
MTPETELAHLRQEVATLRKQMNDLLRFITIEHDDETEEPRNMNLSCGAIMLREPWAPHRMQGFLGCSGERPCVTLYDSREKGRVI